MTTSGPDTKYKQERTLARRLKRPAGESPDSFKNNISRLRTHFERFNVDVSELCQWLMGLRPGGKRGGGETDEFYGFFLEPENSLLNGDESDGDKTRRIAFDFIADISDSLAQLKVSGSVSNSIRKTARLSLTPTAVELFKRMPVLSPAHRQVLLKAAAEWVFARYQRGADNWKIQHKAWKEEKEEWESKHPELTEEVIEAFNGIFKEIEVREKRARICSWERLSKSRDDCDFAGERLGRKNHSPLCAKYKRFYDSNKNETSGFKRFFIKNAEEYLTQRKNSNKKQAMEAFLKNNPKASWFPEKWDKYLETLQINEEKVINGLPHCTEFGDERDCEFNKHTEKCRSRVQ